MDDCLRCQCREEIPDKVDCPEEGRLHRSCYKVQLVRPHVPFGPPALDLDGHDHGMARSRDRYGQSWLGTVGCGRADGDILSDGSMVVLTHTRLRHSHDAEHCDTCSCLDDEWTERWLCQECYVASQGRPPDTARRERELMLAFGQQDMFAEAAV